MDRGAWQGYSPWACRESDTTEQLSLFRNKKLTKLLELINEFSYRINKVTDTKVIHRNLLHFSTLTTKDQKEK